MKALSYVILAGALGALPASLLAQDRIEPNPQALAAIEAGEVFRPSGEWQAGEADVGCWVRREFTHGERAIGLVLRRLQPGLPVQHVITGSGVTIAGTVEAGFTPGTGLSEIDRFHRNVFPDHDVFVLVHPPFNPAAAEGRSEESLALGATHYVVQGSSADPIVIETGSVDQAIGVLAQCAIAQLQSFGVSPFERGNYSRAAALANIEEVGARLRSGYGRVSRRYGYQGPVGLRLIVDSDGQLARCDVTTPFIAQPLRELACNTMTEHGVFTPALAADGSPVTDFMIQNIQFEIPPPVPQPNADGTDPRRL
ncbi:hypothetical protein [Aurantiacibacter sp. D1-12]|uniref:hypothetical protein n=1 Tax=Aurantiacibacter sp. D1-12 TaxID=2993658 RepID=UPI00237CA885|nr:hypothetical protein [Aurantiacibacter sp. D1-12]MDE1468196.1 hypothetical protein [Aurantiacibacter sp. D1-12]